MLDFGTDGPDERAFVVLERGGDPIDKWLIGECPYRDWNEFYDQIGRALLEGIAYAHSRETVHRELKLSDFLIDELGRFRLADFGVSKFPEFIDAALDVGAFLQANEPFSPSTGYDAAYSYSTDVWGYATVCLHILTRGNPTRRTEVSTTSVSRPALAWRFEQRRGDADLAFGPLPPSFQACQSESQEAQAAPSGRWRRPSFGCP